MGFAIAALAGAGVLAAGIFLRGSGRVEPAPPFLDFGKVLVGTTARRTAAWTNRSDRTVRFGSFAADGPPFGADAAGFAPVELPPGATVQDLVFTFTPEGPGTSAGRGRPVRRGWAGPRVEKIDLLGEGAFVVSAGRFAVRAAAADAALDFGDVAAGGTATRELVITNGGPADRPAQASLAEPGGIFALRGLPDPLVLPRGGSVRVTIAFTPAGRAPYEGFLLVVDPGSPGQYAMIAIRGRGV
jgi:hypothetical protein